MAHLLDRPSLSLRELRLLPAHSASAVVAGNVDLTTELSSKRSLPLAIPILSAAMQAVTGPEMAIGLAEFGGMGVLPCSLSIDGQGTAVRRVKRYKAGFQTDVRTLSPTQTLREVVALIDETGFSRFPVTDTGIFHGHLLGVLTDKDFDSGGDLDRLVGDRMRKDVQVGVEVDDLATANQLMIEHGRGFLPIVTEDGTLLAVVFKRDRDKHLRHPAENVDKERRLVVAGAISTHPEDRDRALHLIECGVDALLLDASDGHTDFQRDQIAWIRSRSDLPIVAGNIVTADGFDFLAAAGADAIKVGMGIAASE